MHYSKLRNNGAGLTNQIFSFITSIITAFKNKEKVVIVDDFLNDFKKTAVTPISKIFDVPKMNVFLKEQYDIIIVDKNNVRFEILSVKYGSNEMDYIDLTDYYKGQYLKDNKILINKNTCFNDIKGDPCYGIIKKFIMKYKINDYCIEEVYDENLKNDIEINFEGGPYIFTLGCNKSHNGYNNNMFDNILTNIVYNTDFIIKSELVMRHINTNGKINVIHLRLEEDAIIHWSAENRIRPDEYRLKLEEKYINLFKIYISKEDKNIILSSSLSNRVIDYLNQNNYDYMFVNKFFNDREKNAIIDLLVSKCCTNIYIGNYNIKNQNGSVFSYYIWKCMNADVSKIYIDLDKIYDDEVVIR